jgi:hypothetical protein
MRRSLASRQWRREANRKSRRRQFVCLGPLRAQVRNKILRKGRLGVDGRNQRRSRDGHPGDLAVESGALVSPLVDLASTITTVRALEEGPSIRRVAASSGQQTRVMGLNHCDSGELALT